MKDLTSFEGWVYVSITDLPYWNFIDKHCLKMEDALWRTIPRKSL